MTTLERARGGVWVATNAPHDDRMKSRRFIRWADTLVYHRGEGWWECPFVGLGPCCDFLFFVFGVRPPVELGSFCSFGFCGATGERLRGLGVARALLPGRV